MNFSAFNHKNYNYFFTGIFFSNIGTWTNRIAQDWLTLNLTGSAKSLGLVVAAQFFPGIIFAIYAGVLADRFDAKPILLWCNFAGILIATTTGILFFTNLLTFTVLFFSSLLLGIVSAIDGPVRQSYYVILVGDQDLPNALGWNQFNLYCGRLIGPLTGGILIEFFGVSLAFFLNAFTFFLALMGLMAIRVENYYTSSSLDESKEKVVFLETIRFLKNSPKVLIPIGMVSISAMVGGDMQITSALMAWKVFEVNATLFGLLGSVFALGAFLGSLMITRSKLVFDLKFLSHQNFYLTGVWFLIAVAPNYMTYAITLLAAGYIVVWINFSGNMAIRLYVDPKHYGRVWGIYIAIYLGALAISGPILGWISETFSTRSAILFGAITMLFSSLGVRNRIKVYVT